MRSPPTALRGSVLFLPNAVKERLCEVGALQYPKEGDGTNRHDQFFFLPWALLTPCYSFPGGSWSLKGVVTSPPGFMPKNGNFDRALGSALAPAARARRSPTLVALCVLTLYDSALRDGRRKGKEKKERVSFVTGDLTPELASTGTLVSQLYHRGTMDSVIR